MHESLRAAGSTRIGNGTPPRNYIRSGGSLTMKSLSARGLVSSCVISAAAVAALLAPGAANASLLKQCEGENIGAAGSSLQFEAQEVWNKTFNEPLSGSTAKTTCNGTNGAKKKPTVLYRSTSSGKG